jgi:zinc/manganese transport system substrate-binding protein
MFLRRVVLILNIVNYWLSERWPAENGGTQKVITNRRSISALLLLAAGAVACGASDNTQEPAAGDGGITVVATSGILGDLVGILIERDGEVEVLMPPGADPHDFTASPAQAAALRSADLVVVNGLGLEAGMADVLEAAEAEGANLLELAGQLDPLPLSGDDAHDGDENEAEHQGDDPHFWLDPLRVADAVDLMAAALHEIEPNQGWAERAAAYRSELEALHAGIEVTLESVPADRRKLVTNHDAFGYFADRYGFEVVATVIPGGSTLAEPSAAELGDLVETLEREEIRAVFTDISSPATLAEAAAAELGDSVEVYDLYTESLGPEDAVSGYLEMMRANAGIIAAALGE